ncbi:hypothetical protein RH430_005006 [Raoultella ornithinolytica]|nr:hypothetical protein [Raoultella ornithinolytica]
MDKFDRDTQRALLQYLCDIYPQSASSSGLRPFMEKFGHRQTLVANILYLSGHGLIETRVSNEIGTSHVEITESLTKITSKGIDFIRNDGGLGSILNVVNVRLHSDTINKLESIIGSSGVATEEEKSAMISTLRKLPEDAIKHLNLKLLDMGLARLPDAFHAIQTALHGLL